jgi:hypothetical protein
MVRKKRVDRKINLVLIGIVFLLIGIVYFSFDSEVKNFFTGRAIEDYPSIGDNTDEDIKKLWEFVFKESSDGINIVRKSSYYENSVSAYKLNGSYVYFLYWVNESSYDYYDVYDGAYRKKYKVPANVEQLIGIQGNLTSEGLEDLNETENIEALYYLTLFYSDDYFTARQVENSSEAYNIYNEIFSFDIDSLDYSTYESYGFSNSSVQNHSNYIVEYQTESLVASELNLNFFTFSFSNTSKKGLFIQCLANL